MTKKKKKKVHCKTACSCLYITAMKFQNLHDCNPLAFSLLAFGYKASCSALAENMLYPGARKSSGVQFGLDLASQEIISYWDSSVFHYMEAQIAFIILKFFFFSFCHNPNSMMDSFSHFEIFIQLLKLFFNFFFLHICGQQK